MAVKKRIERQNEGNPRKARIEESAERPERRETRREQRREESRSWTETRGEKTGT